MHAEFLPVVRKFAERMRTLAEGAGSSPHVTPFVAAAAPVLQACARTLDHGTLVFEVREVSVRPNVLKQVGRIGLTSESLQPLIGGTGDAAVLVPLASPR